MFINKVRLLNFRNYEEQEKLDTMKNAYDLIDQTNEENADEGRR